jgi:hypothetical protein
LLRTAIARGKVQALTRSSISGARQTQRRYHCATLCDGRLLFPRTATPEHLKQNLDVFDLSSMPR